MRILFIVPYIPSLVRVRSYNFLRVLAENKHSITLMVLQPPGDTGEALPQLREWCESVIVVPHKTSRAILNGLMALPGGRPLQAVYSRSPEFSRQLRELLARQTFDVAHVEHLRGTVLADSLSELPIMFDSVDSISLLFEKVLANPPNVKSRLMATLDLGRTQRFEGQLTRRFDQVAITSPIDRQSVIDLGCDANRVAVVHNGVDTRYFQPQDLPRDPLRLVFTGKMSYHANIAAALDLAEKIMPLVWAQQPNVTLQIVGKDPSPVIQDLAQHPNISVTGFVADMRPYLAQAAIAVVSLRYGVGSQFKVLEAMAMGTPVVCSAQASSALTAEHGRDLLIGDTPEAIAQHILELLASPEQRALIGANGRRYVETHHSWDSAAAHLENLYMAAIQHHQNHRGL
ncbi:MAG: glycosyltransferase [Chloroflexi bacterium]|nr:glycosyltransferase [Chloroflexota bacterium]MDL1882385.1 glycosyltransferase [Anaerolineae bacterium CFX8]